MGDFLSTPNKIKHSEDKENSKIRYGVCGMQGWRQHMEDTHITEISKGIKSDIEVFGVFDGHGGKEVAQFVKAHFMNEFLNSDSFKNGDIKKALTDTFLKMDELMLSNEGKEELNVLANESQKESEQQNQQQQSNTQHEFLRKLLSRPRDPNTNIAMLTGCTACVCVIDETNKKMYFANSGDSRVVLCKKGIAYPMSTDHKPELEIEKNRIMKANGWISEGRIKGNLNLSRTIGDLEYKQNKQLPPEEQMITAFPDINEENITDECDFIIIACDGIWDCLTNQEACEYVKNEMKKNTNPFIKLSGIVESMMDSIIATDLYNETGVGCDNMTCIIIQFKKH